MRGGTYKKWLSQSKIAGTVWFHKKTGVEHLVVLLAHDSLTMIVNVENGTVVFWDECGDELVLEELNKNYES